MDFCVFEKVCVCALQGVSEALRNVYFLTELPFYMCVLYYRDRHCSYLHVH